MASETISNGLREVNRYITTHNPEGKAVYSQEVPATAKWQPIEKIGGFFLGYTTREFPVSLNPLDPRDANSTPKDIANYSKELENPPGLAISTGT
jgi:hypothetical protein